MVLLLILISSIYSQAAGFDCTKAVSKTEKMICSDKELSAKDELLNAAYKKARNTVSTQTANEIRNAQRAWIKNTQQRCQDINCLNKIYDQRIAELRAYYKKPTAAKQPVVEKKLIQNQEVIKSEEKSEKQEKATTAKDTEELNNLDYPVIIIFIVILILIVIFLFKGGFKIIFNILKPLLYVLVVLIQFAAALVWFLFTGIFILSFFVGEPSGEMFFYSIGSFVVFMLGSLITGMKYDLGSFGDNLN